MTLASVVYGARGSGKTHFGAVIAEAVTKEHQRFCAIDLKGDWWGLKAGADGVSEGHPDAQEREP
jgi:CO dehydrogenase nickel-insertion accessory protein CooC1